MKSHTTSQQQKHPKTTDRHARPENKDNLDSRKNEEQDDKGNDVTHNKKETKDKDKDKKHIL
jgi:hypothetical protein